MLAYVYCEPHSASVAPVHSALEGTQPIRRLRELVEESGADVYGKLQALRLPDWSFDAPPLG